MQDFRVAAVTLTPQYLNVPANVKAVCDWSIKAADAGAKLVIFPEGFLTGYDLKEKNETALARNSAEVESIARLAEQRGIVISFGMLERSSEGFHITQMYVGKGLRLFHRKAHLTDWDKQHCVAGNTLDVQDIGFAKLGTLICYDSAFPLAAETLARKGADILIQPSCHGFWAKDVPADRRMTENLKRKRHIEKYWASRAYDFTSYVIYVNHAGETSHAEWFPSYVGIFGPDGEVVSENAHVGQHMVLADLSASLLEKSRATRVGHYCTLADARPELYWTKGK